MSYDSQIASSLKVVIYVINDNTNRSMLRDLREPGLAERLSYVLCKCSKWIITKLQTMVHENEEKIPYWNMNFLESSKPFLT